MGLGNILKKSESLGKKNMKTFLQVNKYDDPKNAMELIGHICTAAKDIDFADEFFPIISLLFDMEEEREKKGFVWNNNLFDNIYDVLKGLETSFLDNTYQLKIAVSGGYSAGKSTFMNMLIGQKEYLPTDMNPTSLVNTFINFNKGISKPIVRGENIKNNLVLLDDDVLASIRHDTQNAKAIANVLKRLIIDMPSKDYLDGITFIDTPGYDNSLNVNRENGTTDKDTAGKAFKDADVIFWCANIGKQVTKEDLDFIRENGGDEKPVVILLSRMKLKAPSEIPGIVKSCYDTASRQLKNVIDVIAFDKDASLDEIYSVKRNTILQLFNKIKQDHSETVLDLCSFCIEDYFDEEMKSSKEFVEEKKKEYNDVVNKLKEARKSNSNFKKNNKDWNDDLRSVIIDSYNEVLGAARNLTESSSYAIDSFLEFFNGVMDFENNDHWGSSSILNSAINTGRNAYDKVCNKHNAAIKYQFFNEEWRKELVEHFEALGRFAVDSDSDNNIDYYESCKSTLSESISAEYNCQQCISEYKPKVLTSLISVNTACVNKRNKHYRNLEQLAKTNETDIFSAVSGNNMERFILCFHTGVELATCNSQGYNVLTWIASNGSPEMVTFLLNHKDEKEGIDLSIKDKNGINIMEAAVIAHNKNVCAQLSKAVPSLRLPENRIDQLSQQNNFNSWFKTL